MHAVTLDRFDRFANTVGLPLGAVRDAVIDTVRKFATVWREHPSVGTLPTTQRERIEAHTASLPLTRLAAC